MSTETDVLAWPSRRPCPSCGEPRGISDPCAMCGAEATPTKRCHWDECPHGENCVHAR